MPQNDEPRRLAPQAAGRACPPLRLLYLTTSAGEGGIERCSVDLAALLLARGHTVTQVCSPGGAVEALCRARSVPSCGLTVRNSGDLAAAWHLARLIATLSADVVHAHSRRDFVPAVAAVALARRAGGSPRLVLHAHLAEPLGFPGRLSGGVFARGADAVVSDAVRRLLLDTHALPPSFVRRIHNGVGGTAFTPRLAGARGRARGRWGVPPDALVVGMVGRLGAKGQDALLAAAPQVLARSPRLHLVLVGPDGPGKDRARLARRAGEAGMGPRVVFAGASTDVPAEMAGFDVFAHLPAEEAFGMAILEAMAAGLPVVATLVGGCPEIVRGGATGLLVRPGDVDGIAGALAFLLGSLAVGADMGAAGRRVALESFSLTSQTDRIAGLYRRLTVGPTSKQPPPGAIKPS